jgi:chromosome segregation ATPase
MTKLWNYLKQKSKTLHELAKEFPNKTYRELEKYRNADRNEEAQRIYIQQENEELKADQGKEIDYHRYWKKRAQEAETETILIKGIGMNSPEMKAAKQKIEELQHELDRIKKENNKLYNKIANLTDPVNTLKKARESGL